MKAVARQASVAPSRGHEHEFEPQYGLPEVLPADERILWQGQPLPGLVARRIFRLHWIVAYFGLLLAWQFGVRLPEAAVWDTALRQAVVLALMSAVALGILAAMARMTATTTVYTLTNKRVVMRIGIVLTVTYNLPLKQIDAAHLRPFAQGDGSAGDIALELRGDTRIAWLQLWPHARPWRLGRPQPMLRCIPDAAGVAQRLTAAWSIANATPARAAEADALAGSGAPNAGLSSGGTPLAPQA